VVSTNDCITALLWRTMTRTYPPVRRVNTDNAVCKARLLHAVNVRPYNDPPMSNAYPGNALCIGHVDGTIEWLVSENTFADVARAVRASTKEWRSSNRIGYFKDYIASLPRMDALGFNFRHSGGPSTFATSWYMMSAYQTYDFGFGRLKALQWAMDHFSNPFVDGGFLVLPRRLNEDGTNNGLEVLVTLKTTDMRKLEKDSELLRWAEMRLE